MSSSSGTLKRKHRFLTIENKLVILKRLQNGESGSSLSKEYGVGKATISGLKKKKDTILNFASKLYSDEGSKLRKTTRTAKDSKLEDAVFLWLSQRRSLGEPVSGPLICEKALYFNEELGGPPDFKASTGWLKNFKPRHGIRKLNRSVEGEKLSSDSPAAETIKTTQMLEGVECKVEIDEGDTGCDVVRGSQMFEVVDCKGQPPEGSTGPDDVRGPQMSDVVEVKMEPPEENTEADLVDESQMFEAVEIKVEPPEDNSVSEPQVFEFVAVKPEPCKGSPKGTEVGALELQAPAPTAKGARSRKTREDAAPQRSPAPPAARSQKSKPTIPRQARKIILNVAECCEVEKKTKQLLYPLSEPLKRAAEYVGRSVENVTEVRLAAGAGSGDDSAGPSPSKKRKTDAEKTDVDERVVRETIEEFYVVRKSLPTLGKLASALQEKTGCEWQSASALRRTLKSFGFVWRKVDDEDGRTFLLERFGQVRRRSRFIVGMRYMREVGREIFYLDESWIDTGLECGKCRDDGSALGGRAGASGAARLVVWSVGSRKGFVEGARHSFRTVPSKKCTTAADFEKWFETGVLPNLPPASVIVMDDAPHHCRLVDPAPSAYDPKGHMVAWLRRRGIECDDTMMKYVLWELIRANGGSRKDYVVDQMASVRGHSVIRLPPNVRDLSAGDLVWVQIVEYVHDRAARGVSFGNLQKLVDAAVRSVTAKDWEGYCERVRAVEEDYWRRDGVVEDAVDEVIRNPDLPDSSDESEGSITEDSETESD